MSEPTQLELPLAAPRRRRGRLPSQRSPRALARLARWLGRRLGARRRVAGLRVVFNPRLRSSAGRACFRERVVELNPRLLDRHPDELVPTLVHELCHLVAGVRAGHGPRWREAVAALGFRPETCHRMPTEGLAARRRRWVWVCPRCADTYERRHRGARRYACARCGHRLRLGGPAGELQAPAD